MRCYLSLFLLLISNLLLSASTASAQTRIAATQAYVGYPSREKNDAVLTGFVSGVFISSDGLPHDARIRYKPRRKHPLVKAPTVLEVETAPDVSITYPPTEIKGFSTRQSRFVTLPITPHGDLHFLEVVDDTGRIEIYWRFYVYSQGGGGPSIDTNHPGMMTGPFFIPSSKSIAGVLMMRRRGETNLVEISSDTPRGYDAAFEEQLRHLFADRPDLLKFIKGHYLTTANLTDAIYAYNTGRKMYFR